MSSEERQQIIDKSGLIQLSNNEIPENYKLVTENIKSNMEF